MMIAHIVLAFWSAMLIVFLGAAGLLYAVDHLVHRDVAVVRAEPPTPPGEGWL